MLRCRDLLLGYQGAYDATTNRVTKNDVGVVYGCTDIDLHFRCTCIPHVYGLSIFYKGKRKDPTVKVTAIFPDRRVFRAREVSVPGVRNADGRLIIPP